MRLFVAAAATLVALAVAPVAGAAKYIVLYKQEAVPSSAKLRVENAGGTVVASYPQIGVVVAE